jgi:hypothetical protein
MAIISARRRRAQDLCLIPIFIPLQNKFGKDARLYDFRPVQICRNRERI